MILRTLLAAAAAVTIALPQTSRAFLMWKAEHEGNTVHVLAKVDFAEPDTGLIAAPVSAAFDAASVALFEFQMDPAIEKEDRKRIVQSAMYHPGDNLIRHLPRDVVSEFNRVCEELNINNNAIVRVKPWAAGYKLNLIATQHAGAEAENFLDAHFFQLAGSNGKAVDYLTQADEAIGFYRRLSDEQNIALFRKQIAEARAKKERMNAAAKAWRAGDTAAAETLVDEAFKGMEDLRTGPHAKMNAEWASKLAGITKYDDKVFAVVPLENTVGPGSLLDELKRIGFAVTQVIK